VTLTLNRTGSSYVHRHYTVSKVMGGYTLWRIVGRTGGHTDK